MIALGKRMDSAAPAQPSRILTSRVASNRNELHAALRLVYWAYLEASLVQPCSSQIRVTRHHLLPTTHVFLAESQRALAGTLTLVRDGCLGLPLEELYPEQVAERRERGISVAEVSSLAHCEGGKTNMLPVVVQLMSHMAQFAKRHGVDQLLITVHPHHVGFYERFIGFEVIGSEKSYAAVCHHPAVPLALDLNTLSVRHPRAYQRFFGDPLSDAELTARHLDAATLNELAALAAGGSTAGNRLGPRVAAA